MKSIGRLGWKLGVAGNVFYDAEGNEWRRAIGAFWWLLVAAALLLGVRPHPQPADVPGRTEHTGHVPDRNGVVGGRWEVRAAMTAKTKERTTMSEPGTLQYRQENIRAAVADLRAAIVAGEAVRADATLETLRKLIEEYFVAAEKPAGG